MLQRTRLRLTGVGEAREHIKCLDGSVPHYYYVPGRSQDAEKKVVVYFQHGGYCGISLEECV